MKLIKITNELKYIKRSRKLTIIEELFKDLNKGEFTEQNRMPVTGFRISDKENKIIKYVDAMRSAIDIENIPNIRLCKNIAINFFKAVDKRIEIPQIARYGFRSTWIHEYEGSFEELLQKCKGSIFGNLKAIENADDVGVVLDYKMGSSGKSSLTFGPMVLEQLKSQFMGYEVEGIAQVFLYTDVDVGDTTTKKFSAEFLNTFIDKAMEEGERISSEISTSIGVKK